MKVKQFEKIVTEMKRLEAVHPDANVEYSFERDRIEIVYPLPRDYEGRIEIREVKCMRCNDNGCPSCGEPNSPFNPEPF